MASTLGFEISWSLSFSREIEIWRFWFKEFPFGRTHFASKMHLHSVSVQ